MSRGVVARVPSHRQRQGTIGVVWGLAIGTAIAASLLVPKQLIAPRPATMAIATGSGLVEVYRTKQLEDVGAITVADDAYIVTVEHSDQLVTLNVDAPSERAVWRFWQTNAGAVFREATTRTVTFPVARSVAMRSVGRRFSALAQTNGSKPAYLFSWESSDGPPRLGDTAATRAVQLDQADATRVSIRPTDDWNTRDLPTTRWLFAPSLARLDGENMAVAMNSADGHAALWSVQGQVVKRLAFIPSALNPAIGRLGGSTYLFYRPMPSNWAVFYHDTRYSGQFGPMALPLAMAELTPTGDLGTTRMVSSDSSMGNVFDFAIDSRDGNRVALAAIAGTKAQPELRVYVVDATSVRLQEAMPIRAVPYRVSIAVTASGALIGLAFGTPNGYEVHGALVPFR